MKKLFTEMLADHYEKTCKLYKSREAIFDIINENKKILSERLNKLSIEIENNTGSLKQLTDEMKDEMASLEQLFQNSATRIHGIT